MQMLKIDKKTKLRELGNTVGERNLDHILAVNALKREPEIGKAYYSQLQKTVATSDEIGPQRKATVLNTLVSDSDIFESAALATGNDWKYLSSTGALPGTLIIPTTITLPDSTSTLGNNVAVKSQVYSKALKMLEKPPHEIDPAIFNEYSSRSNVTVVNLSEANNPFQWFRLPWGMVTLYSSLSSDSVDFPVYPEELSDNRSATYDTMPDLLYQYEQWYVYKNSGPRTNTVTFTLHRDIFSGNHLDGQCEKLIRFCEANLYPEFRGSVINTATVILYIAGKPWMTGILTDVKQQWSGPIGHDGFYLVCELTLSITEVSPKALNYTSVLTKGLID